MTRVLALLRRPLWGLPAWRWLLTALVALCCVFLWLGGNGWLSLWLGALGLPWGRRVSPRASSVPDPAPIGISISDQAEARDRDLAAQQHEAESAAERARIDAARTGLDDAIRELNERRSRVGKP